MARKGSAVPLDQRYAVDEVTGCWNYTMAIDKHGYGHVAWRENGRQYHDYAHRLMYVKHKGPIPSKWTIDHLCRNTRCINPAHLEAVPNAENCRRGSKTQITAEIAKEIRSQYAAGGETLRSLAAKFGITHTHVNAILKGRRWAALLFLAVVVVSSAKAACDPAFWRATYKHSRFTVIAMCKSFTGTIEHQKKEADGDIHIQLRLDPGQGKPLNHANMAKQNGCLVVEPVCIKNVTQADAIQPCKGAPKIAIPPTGSHVRVTGVYLADNGPNHGWIECHAPSSIEVIP